MAPTDPLGKYKFVSLVRRGLATGITLLDDPNSLATTATVPIRLNFASDLSARAEIDIVGPKDIAGLDAAAVVRVAPKSGERDAEYIQFPQIEFDHFDLPWRYTPAQEASDGGLRPWLVLVVLEEAEFDYFATTGQTPLPHIVVKSASSLPELTDSWAWAHSQTDQDVAITGTGLSELLRTQPGRFLSRLICPRRLKPNTPYGAFLVPGFQQGRDAGLGEPPADITPRVLLPTWASGDSNVELPVYYEWRFATGSAGSFKQLASLLVPRVLPETVGRKDMSVAKPGMGLPEAASHSLAVEGALLSLKAQEVGSAPWDPDERQGWLDRLRPLVNSSTSGVTKVVAPPLYGQWYAAAGGVGLDDPRPTGSNPPWFHELSSDPRTRVAAALGTEVVQRDEQSLMLSAWEQARDIREANDCLRFSQLGRETSYRMFERHFTSGFDQTLLFMLGRLSERIKLDDRTIRFHFGGAECGYWLFDLAWRRLIRVRSRVGKKQGGQDPGDLVTRLADGDRIAPEASTPNGLVEETDFPFGIPVTSTQIEHLLELGHEKLVYWGLVISYLARDIIVQRRGSCWWSGLAMLRFGQLLVRLASHQVDVIRVIVRDQPVTVTDVATFPTNPGFTIDETDEVPSPAPYPTQATGPDSTDATEWRELWTEQLTDWIVTRQWQACSWPDLDITIRIVKAALDPRITVPARIRARIQLDSSVQWTFPDPLEPLLVAPVYERAMYEPLAEISKEWILPGLGTVEPNTVALLLTNQKFVESYMVGLNHEMNRELLWNDYPADQRATYFRQFWDTRGFVPEPGALDDPEGLKDIKSIADFGKDSALGDNSSRAPFPRNAPPGERNRHLVLLVRGELIRRYPSVTVYAAVAGSSGPTSTEKHPVFWGLLQPDVAFYGFELTAEQVRGVPSAGDPGWYFVLQEPPAEPRFSDTSSSNTYVTSSELSESTSAGVAEHTYQDPVRVAIHGSYLTPKD